MKIDPDSLHTLRQQKGFTRPQLEKLSGITARTIQRLEQEPNRSQKTREDTLNRLAKALSVEPGVLTGDLPLPEPDKSPVSDQAPKVRLAYDLIKHRYGVSRTEIINMAPLFFVLLAEGSLSWRREKLKEAEETYDRLHQIDVSWLSLPPFYEVDDLMCGGVAGAEADSINKADLFGNDLNIMYFDPSTDNPFVHYLQKLADGLDLPGVVDVDSGVLSSNFKFPYYEICREELDYITDSSQDAKIALETGCARISEIPEKLMAEDAQEERTKWLEERLPEIFKEIPEKEKENVVAKFIATSPQGDKIRDILVKMDSQETNSETEKEGDDE